METFRHSSSPRRTAPFFATPPDMHTISRTPARRASAATRVATLWQMPATRSGRLTPEASWLMTSLSANTVQVEEMDAGCVLCAAQGASSLTSIRRMDAITSRKRPVPAAHLSFITKLAIRPSSVREMIFAS